MREPTGELLHLSDGVGEFFFDQHLKVGADHLVAVAFARVVVSTRFRLATGVERPLVARKRLLRRTRGCEGLSGKSRFRNVRIYGTTEVVPFPGRAQVGGSAEGGCRHMGIAFGMGSAPPMGVAS